MIKIVRKKNDLSVNNEFLQIKFHILNNNITQEYFVKNDGKWKNIICANDNIDLVADREKKDIKYKIKNIDKNSNLVRINFEGSYENHKVKTSINLKSKCKYIYIVNEYSVKGKTKIEYIHSPYFFIPDKKLYSEYKPLDFCWVPNLRPGKNYVIGDHCFRSPAIILQKGKFLSSLIPDLYLLAKHRKMKTTFDFSICNDLVDTPIFSYGFKNYKNILHTYYFHNKNMAQEFNNEKLIYGYYLYLDGEANLGSGYQNILRFLWEKYGEKYFKDFKLPISFDQYARYGYNYISQNPWIFKDFELNNKKCGGIYTIVFTSKRKPKILNKREVNYHQKFNVIGTFLHKIFVEKLSSSPILNDIMEMFIHNTRMNVVPQIMNQAWFNNFRSAYGIYYYGKKWNDKKLISLANKMKNLVLNTPNKFGIFPSVCFCPKDGIFWKKGTKAFEYIDYYHTPDNSTTCYWMLQWYQDLEKDKNLLNFCKKYANFLIKSQLPSGAIPTWVDIDKSGKIKILNELKESASTACSTMFLSELYLVEKNEKYLQSAEKGANFIEKEVIPENKWYDFETFFSCSKKKIGMKDKFTGLYPQNNLCIYWACETFKNLYKITKKEKYLNLGTRCLDLLCLYQQIWNANFLSFNTFGGFGVMNTDAEWNDSRQALFAITLLDYYLLTKKSEYFKRGISALKASFVLMLIPENKKIAPGNVITLRKNDYGAIYENYGHLGYDRRAPGYVMFDWGIGTACTTSALVEKRNITKYFKGEK